MRKRGKRCLADIGQGRGDSRHREKTKRARSDFCGNPVLQLRDRILRHGLNPRDYVQIQNDQNENWFMRIVDGKVLDEHTDDPVLASALWCESNDVTKLSAQFTTAEQCAIRGIIDSGPLSEFVARNAKSKRHAYRMSRCYMLISEAHIQEISMSGCQKKKKSRGSPTQRPDN